MFQKQYFTVVIVIIDVVSSAGENSKKDKKALVITEPVLIWLQKVPSLRVKHHG